MIVKRANMLTCCWLILLFMAHVSIGLKATDSCNEVKLFYEQKGFGQIVPTNAITTNFRGVCRQTHTCCTPEMEDRLSAQNTVEFGKIVDEKTKIMTKMLNSKHDEFDNFFHELIGSAKTSLHILFEETYGDIYTEYAKVFVKFFDDLKLYYEGGVVDFADIFDSFFITLMQQVFKLVNPSFEFDENYMQCIADNINVIKPFADVPQKLSNQIQRSFVAARTFVQALKTGEQVSQKVSIIYPTTGCTSNITRIMSCSKCNGLVSIKPCKDICLNILQDCLCDYEGINLMWNKYLDAMMTLLDRLEGPFDIESVLSPIDVKISEAVMLLQDNKEVIAESVFQQCGKPPSSNKTFSFDLSGLSNLNFGNMRPGFPMRESENRNPLRPGSFDLSGFYRNMESVAETAQVGDDNNFDLSGLSNLKFDSDTDASLSQPKRGKRTRGKRSLDTKERKKKKRGKKARRRRKHKRRKHHRTRDVSTSKQRQAYGKFFQKVDEPSRLSSLISEMKIAQKDTRDFWKKLPMTICEEKAEPSAQQDCWNGTAVSKSNLDSVSRSGVNQACNGELYKGVAKVPDIAIRQQIVLLKEATAKLSYAHRGIDPTFEDLEIPLGHLGGEMEAFSGEGSADGSNVSGNDKIKDDKPEAPKKHKKVKDLEEFEIKLINHALGESISLKETLKDIKVRIIRHPQIKSLNIEDTELDVGDFGTLTKAEKQTLIDIFEIPKVDNNNKVLPTQRATEKPVTTTSSASTVTISISVLCSLAHFLYRLTDQSA